MLFSKNRRRTLVVYTIVGYMAVTWIRRLESASNFKLKFHLSLKHFYRVAQKANHYQESSRNVLKTVSEVRFLKSISCTKWAQEYDKFVLNIL